jgi:ribosomal protein L40E
MADRCPKCEKPIRPGAKFCTFCGHVIQDGTGAPAPAATPPPGRTPPPPPGPGRPQAGKPVAEKPAEGNVFCQHCGAANRPGAKFCTSCGKSPTIELPSRGSRLRTCGFLVLVVLVILVSLVGIAWGFEVDKLLFSTPTPTPDIVPSSLALLLGLV